MHARVTPTSSLAPLQVAASPHGRHPRVGLGLGLAEGAHVLVQISDAAARD